MMPKHCRSRGLILRLTLPQTALVAAVLLTSIQRLSAGVSSTLFVPGTGLAEISTEAQLASDVSLFDSDITYRQLIGPVDLGLAVSIGVMDLDYQADNDGPTATDPLGVDKGIHDEKYSGQLNLRWEFVPNMTWLGSGGMYAGFTDYRSLWLSEYYRQQFGARDDYRDPDPRGHNLSTGLRWAYQPTSGFVQIDFAYLKDEVAPGYELEFIPFPPPPQTVLLRGREDLETYAGRVAFENIPHRRIRTLLEFQVAQTTDRDPRFTVQSSLNWAALDHLVWRNQVAYVIEAPEFESWSASSTLEYDWADKWYLSLFARVYRDTGYIENSLLISDATPELDSLMIGAGLRWQGKVVSAKLVGGPYFTRYGETESGTAPFKNLYDDRDWLFVQAAVAFQF